MGGVSRVDLKGHLPTVEYRRSVDRYFVTYPDIKVELVMAFAHKQTALELAINTYHATPFYTAIPVVPHGTAYPRPWLLYPRSLMLPVPLILVD